MYSTDSKQQYVYTTGWLVRSFVDFLVGCCYCSESVGVGVDYFSGEEVESWPIFCPSREGLCYALDK